MDEAKNRSFDDWLEAVIPTQKPHVFRAKMGTYLQEQNLLQTNKHLARQIFYEREKVPIKLSRNQ